MVMNRPISKADVVKPDLMAAIRSGLESLTVTGPSRALMTLRAQALKAVINRPSLQEREMMLNQAWQAYSRAVQLQREAYTRAVQLQREAHTRAVQVQMEASRRAMQQTQAYTRAVQVQMEASRRAMQLQMEASSREALTREAEELYQLTRQAISASR